MTDEEILALIQNTPAAKPAAVAADDELRKMIQATPAATPNPEQQISASKAAGLGVSQGITFGFGEEMMSGMKALGSAPGDWLYEQMNPDAQQTPSFGERYTTERDTLRDELRRAQEQRPWEYYGGEVAGSLAIPIPGVGALKGAVTATKAATKLGRVSQLLRGAAPAVGIGAGMGTLAGAGHSEGETWEHVLSDALRGGGYGAAVGAGGHLIGKGVSALRGRAQRGVTEAVGDETARQVAKKAEAQASARGTVGQKSGETFKTFDRLMATVADVNESPEVRAAAARALEDPRFRQAVSKARLNYAEGSPDLLGRLTQADEGVAAASAIDVEKATQEALAHPIKEQVLPRIKTYLGRSIPVAVTGTMGPAAGFASTIAMGNPTKSFSNMINNPAVRNMGWSALLRMTGTPSEQAAGMSSMPIQRMLERSLEYQWPRNYAQTVAEELRRNRSEEPEDTRYAGYRR
jgi:hypothetical protein